MYCSNCGSDISEGNTFCTKCGEKVTSIEGAEKIQIRTNYPKRGNLKKCIIIALLIVILFVSCTVIFKEKILLYYAEEYMQEQRYEDVRKMLKKNITDEYNLSKEQKKLHGLYYYASLCNEIEVTAKNIENANPEDFMHKYESNRVKLEEYEEFLPIVYRNYWYEINTQYYIMKYEDFQREYFNVLENEIIVEILTELYEISQNEKPYSIGELKRILEEKETLLSEVEKLQGEKEDKIKKYYDEYSNEGIFSAFVEFSNDTIGLLEAQISNDEKYLKEHFSDYSEDKQYVSSSNTKESLILREEIELKYNLIETEKHFADWVFKGMAFGTEEINKDPKQVQKEFVLDLELVLEYGFLPWIYEEDVSEVETDSNGAIQEEPIAKSQNIEKGDCISGVIEKRHRDEDFEVGGAGYDYYILVCDMPYVLEVSVDDGEPYYDCFKEILPSNVDGFEKFEGQHVLCRVENAWLNVVHGPTTGERGLHVVVKVSDVMVTDW